MSLSVTVLGSSGVFATPERSCSGYLVRLGETSIWMDAGAGTWCNLLRHINYWELDGIFISHRHPDHTTDVFQAYHARYWGGGEFGMQVLNAPPKPLPSIPLWAPQETIDTLTGFYPDSVEAFDMHAVTAGSSIEFGDAHLDFFQMAHPPDTLGVRVERDGAVLAYSADSGPEADFGGLAGDADVFICEATLQDEDKPWEGHLQASQAAQLASSVRARRLVLTHLPPERDLNLTIEQAQASAGSVPVELAHDGLRVDVGE